MAQVTKGEFVTNILNNAADIAAFRAYRQGADTLAKAVNEAWESSNNVVLDSPFVQGLVSALVPTVLSQGALDRMNAEIALQNEGQTIVNKKRYRVPVPEGVTNPYIWVSQYATSDIYAAVTDGDIYVEAAPNTFDCPTATEVI
jgi:hypothetical protein